MLNMALERIMREYLPAKEQQFAGHPLAKYIRHDLPELFRSHFPQYRHFIWDASPGKGQWADAPWIATFDPLVTESAQDGYYPVYLFNRRLDAVYLSFNQGMTLLREEFRVEETKQILRHRASILRNRLSPEHLNRFRTNIIDLQAPYPNSRLAMYEHGHAFGVKYSRQSIPSTAQLIADLTEMLKLYQLATERGGVAEFDENTARTDAVLSGQTDLTLEEKRRFRYHRVIERNRKLAEEAKRIHGYTCQVCRFDFGKVYGDIGKEYIEAHHKIPLSQLAPNTSLSAKNDFAVVCANCHRMIHHKGAPETFDMFVEMYRKRNPRN
jgi:5-methylcytosine-specific restriction enzyme A